MKTTLITSEVDFEATGKHAGYLRVPHSVHRSAYGWIPVPVVSIQNGSGPTLVIMAGNHGDEYEGQIAVSNLARDLEAQDIRGRLILLPTANAPAAQAGLRTSPVDDGNLNRLFPGDALGSPSEMIAHYIETVLMPLATTRLICTQAEVRCFIRRRCCADRDIAQKILTRCNGSKRRSISLMHGCSPAAVGVTAPHVPRWELQTVTA